MVKNCNERDATMVDKGFLIDRECNDKGIKLHRPPFLGKNKQLCGTDGIEKYRNCKSQSSCRVNNSAS